MRKLSSNSNRFFIRYKPILYKNLTNLVFKCRIVSTQKQEIQTSCKKLIYIGGFSMKIGDRFK